MERLYNRIEAAQALGVSPFTIDSWAWKGILERTKVGRLTRYRESALEALLKPGGKSPAFGRKPKSHSRGTQREKPSTSLPVDNAKLERKSIGVA